MTFLDRSPLGKLYFQTGKEENGFMNRQVILWVVGMGPVGEFCGLCPRVLQLQGNEGKY